MFARNAQFIHASFEGSKGPAGTCSNQTLRYSRSPRAPGRASRLPNHARSVISDTCLCTWMP